MENTFSYPFSVPFVSLFSTRFCLPDEIPVINFRGSQQQAVLQSCGCLHKSSADDQLLYQFPAVLFDQLLLQVRVSVFVPLKHCSQCRTLHPYISVVFSKGVKIPLFRHKIFFVLQTSYPASTFLQETPSLDCIIFRNEFPKQTIHWE